jgi:hypothetical protein
MVADMEKPQGEEEALPPAEARNEAAPPPFDEEPPVAEGKRGRLEQFIPDIVRRTFYAGLGAVFTTEEGIRKLASDFHLPKDITNYLIQQAAASKDELFRVVGKELRSFLENVNISGELKKLLTSLSFEIKTEIRFIPNDQAVSGVKPDLKIGRMSVKRGRKHEAAHKHPAEHEDEEPPAE